jgi:hypothetical protein
MSAPTATEKQQASGDLPPAEARGNRAGEEVEAKQPSAAAEVSDRHPDMSPKRVAEERQDCESDLDC